MAHNYLAVNKFPTNHLLHPISSSHTKIHEDWLSALASAKNINSFWNTLHPHRTNLSITSSNQSRTQVLLQVGLLDLIRAGEFFPSLVMAMRTPETSILSILVECELVEDGFNSAKSSITGNYAHRRILSRNLHSQYLITETL